MSICKKIVPLIIISLVFSGFCVNRLKPVKAMAMPMGSAHETKMLMEEVIKDCINTEVTNLNCCIGSETDHRSDKSFNIEKTKEGVQKIKNVAITIEPIFYEAKKKRKQRPIVSLEKSSSSGGLTGQIVKRE